MTLEQFRPKPPEDIKRQAVSNSGYIRELTGCSLIPPSFTNLDALATMPPLQAKQIFGTKRWDFFTNVLRYELVGKDIPDEQVWEMGRTLRLLNNVDQYIADHHANTGNQILYPQQMEVFEALATHLKNGGTEGYFKLPTAFGKTVVFSEFAKAADVRTLVVVPTIELMDQTEDKFGQFSSPTQVGKIYTESKNLGEQVTVITYDSLMDWVGDKVPPEEAINFRPYDFDLVILDEAHHALGERTREALEAFPQAVKLGFTATPYYDEERNLGNLLGEMIYGMSISEAIEAGTLSDFSNWIARTNTDLSGVEINEKTGDYNREQLGKVVDNLERNSAAAQFYKSNFEGDQTIVTCTTVEHAKHVAEEFQKLGIAAEAIYGELRGKRKDILERFKAGETKVLISNKLLDEGVDLPMASRLINLRPTLSPVVAEQRGGRVLRIDPQNPHKEAIIVDFVDIVMARGIPLTFAEVAGAARVQKASGYARPESSSSGRSISRAQRYVADTPGLTVVTEVEEIMRIVNESGSARIQYKDFTQIPTTALCEQFGVGRDTVYTTFDRLRSLHPNLFWSADTRGSRSYATEAGQLLFQEALGKLRPEGQILIPTAELASEWGITPGSTRIFIKGFEDAHPGLFYRPYEGYPGTFTTPEGLEMLRQERQKVQPSMSQSVIDTSMFRDQYGMKKSTVNRAIHRLAVMNPNLFTMPTAKGQSFYASVEGLALLHAEFEQLRRSTDTTGKVRIVYKSLAEEYGVVERSVFLAAQKIAEANPGSIVMQGRNKPVIATPEGEKALRDFLQGYILPEGFSTIDTKKLALSYGISRVQASKFVSELKQAHPEDIRAGKSGIPIVSEAGMQVIQEAFDSAYKPLEGYTRVDTALLAKEYGISQEAVGNQVTRVSRALPEEYRQNQRNKRFDFTPTAMAMLRENLERRKREIQRASGAGGTIDFRASSGALSLTIEAPFRLPDPKIYTIPVSVEYGSEMWKINAARYLVGMRNQVGLEIAQVAERMNCDINDVLRLENGELFLEEMQGDLPRRYAEAIGRPGVYSLYNLMFHLEYGVELPQAA